jgi:hypothetical protein
MPDLIRHPVPPLRELKDLDFAPDRVRGSPESHKKDQNRFSYAFSGVTAMNVSRETSFADAELFEYQIQDFFRSGLTNDLSEGVQRGTEFKGYKFG